MRPGSKRAWLHPQPTHLAPASGAIEIVLSLSSTCLAIADTIYGPYRLRHESVPCAGGTGFFKYKQGQWWSTMFGNDTQSPFREKPAIVKVDFDAAGRVVVAKTQS